MWKVASEFPRQAFRSFTGFGIADCLSALPQRLRPQFRQVILARCLGIQVISPIG